MRDPAFVCEKGGWSRHGAGGAFQLKRLPGGSMPRRALAAPHGPGPHADPGVRRRLTGEPVAPPGRTSPSRHGRIRAEPSGRHAGRLRLLRRLATGGRIAPHGRVTAASTLPAPLGGLDGRPGRAPASAGGKWSFVGELVPAGVFIEKVETPVRGMKLGTLEVEWLDLLRRKGRGREGGEAMRRPGPPADPAQSSEPGPGAVRMERVSAVSSSTDRRAPGPSGRTAGPSARGRRARAPRERG